MRVSPRVEEKHLKIPKRRTQNTTRLWNQSAIGWEPTRLSQRVEHYHRMSGVTEASTMRRRTHSGYHENRRACRTGCNRHHTNSGTTDEVTTRRRGLHSRTDTDTDVVEATSTLFTAQHAVEATCTLPNYALPRCRSRAERFLDDTLPRCSSHAARFHTLPDLDPVRRTKLCSAMNTRDLGVALDCRHEE